MVLEGKPPRRLLWEQHRERQRRDSHQQDRGAGRRLDGSHPFVRARRRPPPPPTGGEKPQPLNPHTASPGRSRRDPCSMSCSALVARTRTTKSSWTGLRPPSSRQLTSPSCRSSTSHRRRPHHQQRRRRRNDAQPRRADGQGLKWGTTSRRWRSRRRAEAITRRRQSPSRPPNLRRAVNPRRGGGAVTITNAATTITATTTSKAVVRGLRRPTAGGKAANPSRSTRRTPSGAA